MSLAEQFRNEGYKSGKRDGLIEGKRQGVSEGIREGLFESSELSISLKFGEIEPHYMSQIREIKDVNLVKKNYKENPYFN